MYRDLASIYQLCHCNTNSVTFCHFQEQIGSPMHVESGKQSPCRRKREGSSSEGDTPVKRSKSIEDSQVSHGCKNNRSIGRVLLIKQKNKNQSIVITDLAVLLLWSSASVLIVPLTILKYL